MSFMKQLKTSTQIALKFTIYFFVIFSVLWITTNGIFFTQRTTNEYNRVKWKQVIMEDPLNNHKWIWWKFKNMKRSSENNQCENHKILISKKTHFFRHLLLFIIFKIIIVTSKIHRRICRHFETIWKFILCFLNQNRLCSNKFW